VLHPPLRTKIFVTSLAALTALGVAAAPSATASPTAAPTPATAPANPAADSARPSGLTVDGLARPADLEDLDSPRLSWIDPADTTQTAYQVVVSSTAARAAAHDGDVWDSGRVASARQTDVAYGGTALERTQRYYWSVRTWDARGKASGWSQPAWFGTGPGTDWAGTQSIWSPNPATQWTDYTLHAKVTVTAVALGLTFRAKDAADSYMWQLRGADNQLKTHVQVGGSYTVLKTVNLPAGTLAVGKQVDVAIAVEGSTITTIIDGKVVDTTTDRTWPTGVVGVRTGGSESGTVDDLRVVDDAHPGTSLLATSFDAGDATFPCGTVGGGVLTVGKSTSCLVGAASNNWAFLRDDVSLPSKDVAWATLFATATSPKPARQYVYKMYVNGRFVGLGPTQSVGAETRYDGFDVTSDLRAGANALGAIAYTTSGQRLEAQLVVRYADGTTDTFGTGNGWKALSGSAVYPNVGSVGTGYYTAPMEDIDNTKFPTGFDEPGYDDSAWAPVSTSASLPQLTATPTAKVQQQLERPVKIVDKGDGDYFIDFGRTWVGGVHYEVADGTAGDRVTVRYGEVTSAPDTVRYQLNTGNTYQDVYTLRNGAQSFDTWGIRVFRYVEIQHAPEPITKDNLQALALLYPFDESAATFTSSDDNLDQVWQLSKNTVEATNLNLYVDSWTRERGAYEADTYLQLQSALDLDPDISLGKYTLNYFQGNRTWPTEWPMYVILAVHDAWQQTADPSQLADFYSTLQSKLPTKWLDSGTGLVAKTTGSNGCGSVTDCDIVDWPASERDGFQFHTYNTVVNALAYRSYRDMADIATAIGKDDDAAAYTATADRMRAAINDKLYDATAGRYVDGMTSAGVVESHAAIQSTAFALAFGVPTDRERDSAAKYAASRGMVCSVYCAAFLIRGLYDGGQDQAAQDLLTSEGTRSWMNMIKLGAGATAEAWDPSLKSNLTYSHPWAASPAFTVPTGLFGIQPTTAGYATFEVAPKPGDLAHAAITVPTVKGTIGAAFDHDAAGALRMVTQVPANTTATVAVPTGTSGRTTLYVDRVPYTFTAKDGVVTVDDVAPGCHTFATTPGGGVARDTRLTGVCTSTPGTGVGALPDAPGTAG
jgi:alpha-L-rhamnosidase